MARAPQKEEAPATIEFLLPRGRLINHSLFEKDAFDEKSVPSYKCEIALDPKEPGLDDIINRMYDAVCAFFNLPGEPPLDIDNRDSNKAIITPFLDGDTMAAKRAEKGKQGDAYKGMYVVRTNTIYNRFGQDAPGGATVFDEDVGEVTIANADKLYPGCYVQVAVALGFYVNDKTSQKACKFYLKAVQKVGDGERLIQAKDYSQVFKPVGRTAAAPAEGGGVRRRRG